MDEQLFTTYFIAAKRTFDKIPIPKLMEATQIIKKANRVWLVGNGGSAATAIHFANDLQKMCGLDVICLPAMVSTITAYGNDEGWKNMFSLAMKHFKAEDVLVAISFSGNSPNVVDAASEAMRMGGSLVSITGPIYGKKNELSGFRGGCTIAIDEVDIKVVEDIHLSICHAIAGAINAMRRI